MKTYLRQFLVFYFFATIVVAVASTLLKISSTSLGFAAVFSAAYFAASKFTTAEDRVPSGEEVKSFANSALVGVWVISFLQAALVYGLLVPAEERRKVMALFTSGTGLAIMGFALAFITVLYYFAIRWSFSWGSKTILKAAEKRRANAAARRSSMRQEKNS